MVTVEKGGFGAEAAAPAARLILEKWFGVRGGDFVQGASGPDDPRPPPIRWDRRVSSATTPIQPASEPPPALVPREWRLRLDPLLLLAVLGLVACSIVTLKGATRLDVEGQPYFYVYRQALYAGVGLVLMYASRGSTTRACRTCASSSTAC